MSTKPTKGYRRRRSVRGRRKRAPSKVAEESLDVLISALGAQGDGVSQATVMGREQSIYVPGALPGEVVRITTQAKRGDGLLARIDDIVEPSPDRREPPCPHYAKCGGCVAQHMSQGFYTGWKRERIVQTLAQRGFEGVDVFDARIVGEKTRRRVTFGAQKRNTRLILGFNARSSHDLVAVDRCPIAVDEINALIAPLNALLHHVLEDGERARVQVTACDNGLDVMIEASRQPGLAAREKMASMVLETSVVRLGWKGGDASCEPIAQEFTPLIYLSGVPVEFPQGAFLQASNEGEHAIRDAVLAGMGGDVRRIADLFCGLGSFSIPLSHVGVVDAFDVTPPSIRALERAAGRADLGGRVKPQVRDLSRQPLDVKDLSQFDAVVFDPPRAGALEQVQLLAQSGVDKVVAVSCNPATFARDARILADGGFELLCVQPIDQFTYSAHVELVAQFVRRNI